MAAARLKYFDCSSVGGFSGRGGGIRFYMLTNGIKFEEELVDYEEWTKEGSQLKADAVSSGESPTGHLPVLRLDGQDLIETFAILRLLAKRVKAYGADETRDYKVDAAVDATVEFRYAWHDAVFGSPEDQGEYLTSPAKRRHFYKLFNSLIELWQGSGPHVVGSTASFADAVVFSLLWDDVAVFKEEPELWEANPQLESFYRAYLRQEPVLDWCRGMRSDLCEGI